MTEQQVEISSFDLRYQGYRMRNQYAEKRLFQSILENGIQDPLQGINTKDAHILLNGFKRIRCAKQLGINIIPYISLSDDEASGILELLRIANSKSLTILEQAKLIDELKTVHGLGTAEIAKTLEKSKAWVSVRTGMLEQMTPYVIEKIMSGVFPAYSYMYTLRQFMRINAIGKKEVEAFVRSVSGKGFSTRDIETLAHGFFKGSEAIRQQIGNNASWALNQLRHSNPVGSDCSQLEQSMLQDLTIVQKYIGRVISKISDDRYKSNSFYAQANLLTGGILKRVDLFSKTLKDFHDRSRQT